MEAHSLGLLESETESLTITNGLSFDELCNHSRKKACVQDLHRQITHRDRDSETDHAPSSPDSKGRQCVCDENAKNCASLILNKQEER